MFNKTETCKGCGFAIEPSYWISEAPDFCLRCSTTLRSIASRWRETVASVTEPRTLTHIKFSREYATKFNHGAPGHLDLVTIALLAGILDDPAKVLR